MGPWHHVGPTMEITLDKNWIIGVIRSNDPLGTESLQQMTRKDVYTCIQL